MIGGGEVIVIGAGWLGQALAATAGTRAIPRRTRERMTLLRDRAVIVASGRGTISGSEGEERARATEVAHLREILDAAEVQSAVRVVVVGSSDVCGMAPVINGRTPQAPRTVYASVKAAVERECVARAAGGLAVTHVRLAPVHGPGKQRSHQLVASASRRLALLPNGGRHSVGFVALPDAVKAVLSLTLDGGPPVCSVGAGHTPMSSLFRAIALASGQRVRILPVPIPSELITHAFGRGGPDMAEWMLRLASPRSVSMEAPIEPMALDDAAGYLARECS
jgi:nucleoside-diphosphate-sugar epimerase